jgi:hypothetical protein
VLIGQRPVLVSEATLDACALVDLSPIALRAMVASGAGCLAARIPAWSVQVHVIRLGCGPPFDACSARDQALRFDRRWVS